VDGGMRADVERAIAAHQQVVASLDALVPDVVLAGEMIATCIRGGGKVLACGNGGSAADAQHIVAEFVGRFLKERAPMPAIALTVNTSVLTAVGNDYGFDDVFSRQVVAHGRPGDVLIGLSTSGNSPNVLRAVEAAAGMGMGTVGFSGPRGLLTSAVDVCIAIPSDSTPRIQEAHILLAHILCGLVEDACC
jgi:D-sedoheptulose 7-phosphate isomerase